MKHLKHTTKYKYIPITDSDAIDVNRIFDELRDNNIQVSFHKVGNDEPVAIKDCSYLVVDGCVDDTDGRFITDQEFETLTENALNRLSKLGLFEDIPPINVWDLPQYLVLSTGKKENA